MCRSENRFTEANSITPSSSPSNNTGSTTRSAGADSDSPERTVRLLPPSPATRMVLRVTAACPTSPSPGPKVISWSRPT